MSEISFLRFRLDFKSQIPKNSFSNLHISKTQLNFEISDFKILVGNPPALSPSLAGSPCTDNRPVADPSKLSARSPLRNMIAKISSHLRPSWYIQRRLRLRPCATPGLGN